MTVERRPYVIFEIDFPRCTRSYGEGACTASLANVEGRRDKCKKSRFTCQALAAYLPEMITHRYVESIDGLPKEPGYFPMLRSVSTRPVEINTSGFDPNSNPLGVRARGTAVLADADDNGSFTDPYAAERRSGAAQWDGQGYLPEEFGSHWGKLIATQPYYEGLPCRVLRGYVGQAPAEMTTEHYVITKITGPDLDGRVTVKYKDVLDLANKDKALAPKTSQGKLAFDVPSIAATAILVPAGIGETYAEAGLVTIGREIIAFERVGDVLTFTERGAEGSEVSDHQANDQVQEALVYDPARPSDVIADLLIRFGNVPDTMIPLADWKAEYDAWFAGLLTSRTVIPKPTPVPVLIGELCQIGAMVFPDVRAGDIKFRMSAPLKVGEVFQYLDEDTDIREGTLRVTRGEDLRATPINLAHGVIDWTEAVTSLKNFTKLSTSFVADDPYSQLAIRWMYMRWFGREGNEATASVIVDRLMARYQEPPFLIEGEVDTKSRAAVELASLTVITSRLFQTPLRPGPPELTQIRHSEEVAGDRIKFKAEQYRLRGRFGYLRDDPMPEYADASEQERAEGCFMVDDTIGEMPDGSEPYVFF
ncbi:MAG: hypothetical protein AAGI09_11870 [Pseudomonadota bacterium]